MINHMGMLIVKWNKQIRLVCMSQSKLCFLICIEKYWITKTLRMVFLIGKIMSTYCFPVYTLLKFLKMFQKQKL